MVYDVTSRKSFDNILRWIEQIDAHAPPKVTRLLVGNKSDCAERVSAAMQSAQMCLTY